MDNYKIFLHGRSVTEEMKDDIITFYLQCGDQSSEEKCKAIASKLDKKYGICWCVIIYDTDEIVTYSLSFQERSTVGIKFGNENLLAYLVDPYFYFSDSQPIGPLTNYQNSYKYPRRITEHTIGEHPSFDHVYRPYLPHYQVPLKK